MTEEVLANIRGLVPFPRQGHRRPDLTNRSLRFIRVRDYLIAYAPERSPLFGDCRHARTPQPARYGRDPQRQGIMFSWISAVSLDVSE